MSGLKIIVLFMALAKIGDAQINRYPLLTINESGDTICSITMPQLKKLNVQLLHLEECSESGDSMATALNYFQILNTEKTKVIQQLTNFNVTQDSIIKLDKKIFDGNKKIILDYQTLDRKHMELEETMHTQIGAYKTATVFGGIAIIILVAKVIFF